jgi:hypothetical protein
MVRVRITADGAIEAKPVVLATGYAFCDVCGGLFKLSGKDLPVHMAVGRGAIECRGGKPTYEGEVSP